MVTAKKEHMFNLFLWSVTLGLLLYALIRGRAKWLTVLVPVAFYLLISVLIAIEVPNSDWVRLVLVAVP